MSVIFHPMRVRSIEPDTQEAVIVSFDVPAELREVFGFIQSKAGSLGSSWTSVSGSCGFGLLSLTAVSLP